MNSTQDCAVEFQLHHTDQVTQLVCPNLKCVDVEDGKLAIEVDAKGVLINRRQALDFVRIHTSMCSGPQFKGRLPSHFSVTLGSAGRATKKRLKNNLIYRNQVKL